MSTRKSISHINFPEQATNLQHFMEIQRLNIQDVSEVCGFSYYNFRNWKAGVHKVPALARQKMKEVYGLNPEWIIGRSTQMYLDPAQQSQSPAETQTAGGSDGVRREITKTLFGLAEKVTGKTERGLAHDTSGNISPRKVKKHKG